MTVDFDIEATVQRAVTEMREDCRRDQHDAAIRGMQHNMELARRTLEERGHVSDYMKGHYCATISTYATIAGTVEAQEMKRRMTDEIMTMSGGLKA